ncbi:molecular chaperone [Pseudomonas sp. CCNWLW23]
MFSLFIICAKASAAPQINVGPIYDYMEAGKTTYLKRIYNSGDSTAFVKVNVLEIFYNADGSTSESLLEDSAGTGYRNGLVASPARLIIPAQGMQATRLVFMGERYKERYFRVRFVPVIPEKEEQLILSNQEQKDYKKGFTAGLNVMTGFGTIFFVQPQNSQFDTIIDDSEKKYELRNNGNTVVIVDEFKDCSQVVESECQPTTKSHVLPSKVFSFNKEKGRKYSFTLIEGPAKRRLSVLDTN